MLQWTVFSYPFCVLFCAKLKECNDFHFTSWKYWRKCFSWSAKQGDKTTGYYISQTTESIIIIIINIKRKNSWIFGRVMTLWNRAASITRSLQYSLCFEVNAEKMRPFLSSLHSDDWYDHVFMWVYTHMHTCTSVLLNLRFTLLFCWQYSQGIVLKRPKLAESTKRSKHTLLSV